MFSRLLTRGNRNKKRARRETERPPRDSETSCRLCSLKFTQSYCARTNASSRTVDDSDEHVNARR